MKQIWMLIGVLATLFFVSACASHGEDIDMDYASTIKKGVTTEQEIIDNLGQPQNIGLDGHGNKIMTYVYAKSQAKAESFIPVVGSLVGGADTESKSLVVIVDSSTGIVKDFAVNSSKTETKTGVL